MKYLIILFCFLNLDFSAQNSLEYTTDEKVNINENATRRIQLNDTIFLIEKFYTSGRLYSQTEVFYETIIDTSYTEDLDTGEMTMVVEHYSNEIFHGNHRSIVDSEVPRIIAKGKYHMGVKIGDWTSEYLGIEEITRYNESGELMGYTSFFENKIVRMQGKFCKIPSYIHTRFEQNGDKAIEAEYYPQPCGTWNLYDETGNLLQKISYEHVNRN